MPRTTGGDPGRPAAGNQSGRRSDADLPDRQWAVDIAFVPTGEGLPCVAGVTGLCRRRISGWSMADHRRADLVADAARTAIARRRPGCWANAAMEGCWITIKTECVHHEHYATRHQTREPGVGYTDMFYDRGAARTVR